MANGEVYVVVEILEILDETELEIYLQGTRQQIRDLPGVLIARDAKIFEGPPIKVSMMIQRWPSEKAFRDWQESEAYRPLRERRLRAARHRIAIIPAI